MFKHFFDESTVDILTNGSAASNKTMSLNVNSVHRCSHLENLVFNPGIHDCPCEVRCLAHTPPLFAAGRGREYDKVPSALCNKAAWHPIFATIPVNESPDKGLEVGRGEVFGSLENTSTYEQVAPLITIPNYRLPFRKAPAYSIIDPDRLPFSRLSYQSKVTDAKRGLTDAWLSGNDNRWGYIPVG